MPDNKVLQYFREKDPRFAQVDDSTLTSYIREKHPEFIKDLDSQQITPPWYQKPLSDLATIGMQDIVSGAKAVDQMQQGNVGGGIVGAINSGVQKATVPLAAVNYGVSKIPWVGKPLSTAAEAVGTVVGYPGKVLGEAIANVFPRQNPEQQAYNVEQAGQLGATTSQVAIPTLAGEVAGTVASKLSNRLYQSAVKFPPSMPLEEKLANATTGISERIAPTQGGYTKLWGKIDELNQSIADEITQSAQQGTVINSANIIPKLDELRDFYKNTTNPKEYIDKIDELQNEFLQYHGQQIPIDVAQKIKQNTYALIHKSFGEMSTVTKETQKGLARGLKDEIAANANVAEANARESSLLNLSDAIENAAGKGMGANLINHGANVAAAAGGLRGGMGEGALWGTARALIDNPWLKAQAAFAVNDITKLPPFLRNVSRITPLIPKKKR